MCNGIWRKFPSRKFWMNFVSSTERLYIGSSPSEYFRSFCRIDGYSLSGPAADVRSKRLIARITSDDFIRGAGARLSICVTRVAGVDGEGWRRARSSCTVVSAVSARGSLDKAEIALRYSPFSAHAGTCVLRTVRAAGQRGGVLGGEVREIFTSISEEPRKLPIESSATSFSRGEGVSERLLRRDGSFRPLSRSRAVGRA